jgi:hypothetical protein
MKLGGMDKLLAEARDNKKNYLEVIKVAIWNLKS